MIYKGFAVNTHRLSVYFDKNQKLLPKFEKGKKAKTTTKAGKAVPCKGTPRRLQ